VIRLYWLFLILPLLSPADVLGQNTAPPPAPSKPAASSQGPMLSLRGPTKREIQLYVQATDKSGHPVRGLQWQDFAILDNNQPQKVASFNVVDSRAMSTSDSPVEIVLVVDAINTGVREIAYERDEIKKFLLRNGGKLEWPLSFIFFTESGTNFQNGSSRDGVALADAFDKFAIGLRNPTRYRDGIYGASERIDLSLKTLSAVLAHEKMQPGRKLILWIGPGWPLLSPLTTHLGSTDKEGLFGSIVNASTEIRQDGVTLYSVTQLFPWNSGGTRIRYYENFLKPVTAASQVEPSDMGVQVLSIQSGGRVINSSNDLNAAIASCVADADAYYVLAFDSQPAKEGDEYHSLQVTVDRPGITVRTRTGYYDQR
jgi:VWFA-related protein